MSIFLPVYKTYAYMYQVGIPRKWLHSNDSKLLFNEAHFQMTKTRTKKHERETVPSLAQNCDVIQNVCATIGISISKLIENHVSS
jgi:hypothetical protein